MSRSERLALVDHDDSHMPVVTQCRLLKVARSTLYYRPVPVSADDLSVMRRMDELHLAYPFYGSRRMAAVLRREGRAVNRKRAQRLMEVMGIEALYQKPNTSKGHPDHKIYPYLLRGLSIDRPNQVWCADITYISMAKGFVYLVAVMDWFSRRVLSWRLSITMETDFCVEALTEAMDRYGLPEIFNTDQGVQFTSAAFIDELADRGVRISMDGKGRYLDNIFIERLWRSLKYEEVYIRAYDSVAEARRSLGVWLAFYNDVRPHQSFEYRTPREVFEGVACEPVDNISASLRDGRVGTEDYSSAPLTEPYVRVTHTAPWIDRSESQHQLGRYRRSVQPFPQRFQRGHPPMEPGRRIGPRQRGVAERVNDFDTPGLVI